MVNTTVDLNTVHTKKTAKKRLLSQLGESDSNFKIEQGNHEAQARSRTNAVDRDTFLNNTKNPNQVIGSQMDMHTLEKNVASKVQFEVDNVMTTVETRVPDAVMTAIKNLVFSRVELAMKSVNASSGHVVGSFVLDPDQRDFSGKIESQQMTASSRMNSHTVLSSIDETCGNIIVEGGDLLVNERNIDQQTHTYHSNRN